MDGSGWSRDVATEARLAAHRALASAPPAQSEDRHQRP